MALTVFQGRMLCLASSHPVLNTSNTQGALASMDNDLCPKRTACCFHWNCPGKVLRGATPGIHSQILGRLSCPVNCPESWQVKHHSPHRVDILISQVYLDFQTCLLALDDIRTEGTQRTLRKKHTSALGQQVFGLFVCSFWDLPSLTLFLSSCITSR